MESTDFMLLWITLIGGTAFTVGGVLGWAGWISVGFWARWTRANRTGGRNQVLFGLVLIGNGILTAFSAPNGFGPLTVLVGSGMLGYLALSILHRRRYGPRPAADSAYASKRSW